MDKQITLNETHKKLLKEYIEADARFQNVANRIDMIAYAENELDAICKEFKDAFQVARQSAAVFARSVAEEIS